MKSSIKLLQLVDKIQSISPQVGGVFSYADLSNIIAGGSTVKNSRIILKLTRENILTKIQKGFYVAKKFDPWLIAARIEPNCYISMDTVLAKEGLITTMPAGIVSAVVAGKRNRRIHTPQGDICFHSISKDLRFGIVTLSSGVKTVVPEKAYLDLLYFYQKGTKFAIDPVKEVNLTKLNKGVIEKYLDCYRNPKFVKFVRGLLYEKQ